MKKLLLIVALLICSASWADGVWCLLVPTNEVDSMMARLDTLIVPTQTTQHYSDVVSPLPECATYPYRLLTIDDRAQSALTEEEWASRLATMPIEFLRPLPTP